MTKAFSIALLLLSVAPVGAAATEIAVSASVAADATRAVQAAIDRARTSGGGTIRFEKGEYHFRSADAATAALYISNHDKLPTHPVFLPLTNLVDVTVDGGGSRFVFHGQGIAALVMDSVRVTLKGFSIDWSRPYNTELTVRGFADGGTLVSVDRTRFPVEIRNGKLYAIGEDWAMPTGYGIVFDGTSHEILERVASVRFDGTAKARDDGLLWLGTDLSKIGLRGAKAGDVFVSRPCAEPWRPHPAIAAYRATDTVLEDIVIHAAFGMGVLAQRCENFALRGTGRGAEKTCGAWPSEGRACAQMVDATHFVNVKGKVSVTNSRFERMLDDAINVHSTGLGIVSNPAPDVIVCRGLHEQGWGFEMFRPGETLRFIRARTLENGDEVRVTAVRALSPRETELRLERPVPAGFGVGDAVENADWQCSVDFTDNIVARNMARGVLFTTPKPVRVERNLFENVSGAAVLLAGDVRLWHETGGCRDVRIAKNVFRNCLTSKFQYCEAVISAYPTVEDVAAQTVAYHQKLTVADNVFETFDAPLLFARSVDEIAWRNNSVVTNDLYTGWGKPRFTAEGCRKVEIETPEKIPFARQVAFAAKPAARPRRLDRTWIFAERQLYGGHQNLLHIWADRPLYHDIGLREATIGGLDAAFLKDVGVLRAVGLDGFASLDHYPVHLRQLQRLGELKEPVTGYSQMIVIPGYATEKDYPKIKNMILTAAKSPYTTRLDGKLVFWCYGWGEQGRHEWWAKRLRSDAEIPPFLFIGDMPLIDIYRAWNKHEGKGERTPEAEVAAFRKKVEDAIAVMDGFQVRCTEYYWDHLGDYEHRSEKAGFYRDYLLPIALEVMARPENRGKLLGTYVRQGYTNRFTGVVDGQYGTETLRNYLDEILLLNPDVLMCFEWNEAEENTYFQPTVANGTTYARILAHYRALLDRKPFAPMPGDDTRIPNFIVSVRQSLRLGETYRVELLYLPDGTGPQEIRAQIRVKDEDGRVLVRLPEERFATDRLTAITYKMPSEKFPSAQTLRVELATDVGGEKRTWTAFDVTRMDATRCKNYLYTHHPLREQLAVRDDDFRIAPTETGTTLAAAVSAPEPLAAFEVLDGTEEIAAADRENRFDRRRFAIFRGMLSAMDTGKLGWTKGTVAVTGAPQAEVAGGNYPWEGFHLGTRTADGKWALDCNLGSDRSNFFVCVPKDNLPNATLALDLKDAAAFRVPLADVNRLGRQAWQLATGVRLDLERADDLPDVAKPLNVKDATIAEVLPSQNRFPVYQPRAVSLSGKTWRGAPVLRNRPSGAAIETTMWSDYERRAVKVSVAADRLPVFDYRFTPEYGALLPCDAGRRWYATLGGATVYAEPMRYAFWRKRVPADFVRADPVWEKEGNGYALRFDGKGSYLALPAEVIPRGSVYTLDFEICPEANGDYVLLRQQRADGRNVGLQLVVANGQLRVSHFGVKLVPRHFDTGLAVPNGQWSHVRLVKGFESISVTVNGQTFRTAYDRRADMFQGAVFGCNIEPGPGIPEGVRPFKGLLRQLSVKHGNPDNGNGISNTGPQSHEGTELPKST